MLYDVEGVSQEGAEDNEESDSGEGHVKAWIEEGGCRGVWGVEETAVWSQRKKQL